MDKADMILSSVVVTLSVLLSSGCSDGYQQPRLPDTDVARVRITDRRMYLRRIDGRAISTVDQLLRQGPEGPTGVKLLPGRHAIELRYAGEQGHAEGRVTWVAVGGHCYLIKCSLHGYALVFWVEDVATREIVDGH
jgi:hypothetical protein